MNCPDHELAAIEELHRQDREAALKGDVETLLSLFTDDGIVIPSEGEIIKGKDALRKMLLQDQEMMKDLTLVDYRQDFEEIEICGDLAIEWGFYRGEYLSGKKGEKITGSGKLMRILKRDTVGSWKVHRAIWTVEP